MSAPLHVINHPLVQHKLTLLRQKGLSTRGFRELTQEIGALLAYELMRDAPTRPTEVETPLGVAQGVELDGKKQVLVAILRRRGVSDGLIVEVTADGVDRMAGGDGELDAAWKVYREKWEAVGLALRPQGLFGGPAS